MVHDLNNMCVLKSVPQGQLEEFRVGLQTIPSDRYGCTNDGQVMGMAHLSTVCLVWWTELQWGQTCTGYVW